MVIERGFYQVEEIMEMILMIIRVHFDLTDKIVRNEAVAGGMMDTPELLF